MRALKILDGEDACARQSPGTCERQSTALPRLRRQPVLFKGRRFAPADVCQLCPRDPPTNPLQTVKSSVVSKTPAGRRCRRLLRSVASLASLLHEEACSLALCRSTRLP